MDNELKACLSLFPYPLDRRSAPFDEELVDGSALASAERVRDWCSKNGARILYPGHAEYPFDLVRHERPPRFLSVWGNSVWRETKCISVVGSREPTRLASEWMDVHLSKFVSRTGAATVSGGAIGVDWKAHMISLRARKPTVVFLPSGLGKAYPKEWLRWKDEVIDTGGALVSTYPPLMEIKRAHFEERNRWIAAMGEIVFVVEARRRSGSSMTARLAREIDRTICCLPGPPGDARCAGTVDLLFEGGLPIRDSEDLEILFEMHRARVSIPSAPEAEGGGDHEDEIREPHGDPGRDLPLA